MHSYQTMTYTRVLVVTLLALTVPYNSAFCPPPLALTLRSPPPALTSCSSIPSDSGVERDLVLHEPPRVPLPSMTRKDRLDLQRHHKRIERLEAAVEDICSAILHADDVALLEREGNRIGSIYMDTDLSKSRNPRMLRRTLMQAMVRHQFAVKPPENHWHCS